MSASLAAAVVRARVALVVAWVIAAVACVAFLPSIREAQTGALGDLVPVDAAAIDAEERSAELFAFPVISRTMVVQRREDGLTLRSLRAAGDRLLQINQARDPGLRRVAGGYAIANVTGSAAFAPERGTTVVLPLLFSPDVGSTERTELAQGLVQRLRPTAGGAFLDVTGVLPARDAQSRAIQDRLPLVELLTLLLVVGAVALHTRSLAAPGLCLAAVAISYLVSIRVVAAVGERVGISVPSEVEPVVVALLFGVVTDYLLFFLSRFRRRIDAGLDGPAAARSAATELAPILTACGLTVAAGCSALLVAELGFLQAFGPGIAVSVLVALIVALTFVPAALALLGSRTFWPSRPRREAEPEAPRTARLLRVVVRRPLVAAVACLAFLGALGSGVAWLDVGNPIIRGLPPDAGPRVAYEQVSRGLTPGIVSPTVIVVERRGITPRRAELADLQRTLSNQPGVAAVVGPATSAAQNAFGVVLARSGDAARFVVLLADDPLGSDAVRRLANLRERFDGLLEATGLDGARFSVAGDTALVEETIAGARQDLGRIIPAVLGAIALVLIVFLRGLVAPLYLVALSLLAPVAALGLTVAVFQGLLGVEELTYFVPIAAGVLLVALGSDYNVFLVGRIWAEARSRPLREAIVAGGAGSSRAIAAAGLVLAASFAAIAAVPVAAFRELAFLVATGLLLDAFVVRTILVPAVIALVGERSAWPGTALRRQGSRARDAVAPSGATDVAA